MDTNDEVGLIGVGLVGSALAQRLTGAGFSVIAYDVDAAFGQASAGLPVRIAASARDVAKAAAIVLLALPDTNATEAVIGDIGPAGDGDLDSSAIIEEYRRRNIAPEKPR